MSYKLMYIHEIKSFNCATYIYTSQFPLTKKHLTE